MKPQATLLVALLLLQISGQPKERLGEVEPGVFTIQGIVGHELMEDALQAQLLVLLFLLEFLLSKSIGSLIIICWHLRVIFAWFVATI